MLRNVWLVGAVVRKDLRLFWGWLILLLAVNLGFELLRVSVLNGVLPFETLQEVGFVFVALRYGLSILLTARIVVEDSPGSRDALWHSRPVPWWVFFLAKVILTIGLVTTSLALLQALSARYLGASWQHAGAIFAHRWLFQAGFVTVAFFLASLSRGMTSFVAWSASVTFAGMIWLILVLVVGDSLLKTRDPFLTGGNDMRWAFFGAGLIGLIALAAIQWRTRRRWLFGILGSGWAASQKLLKSEVVSCP
jgi:hypothetical protein